MRYAVVIEKGSRNYSAYAPDLPGCVSVGDTLAEVKKEMREAIEFHLEGMRADSAPISPPSTRIAHVALPSPGRRSGESGRNARRQGQGGSFVSSTHRAVDLMDAL
jgi:predicted RNase H-like HicB family nuclease